MEDRRGLGVNSKPEGVCAVKKAGVSDPEGSAGLLRAMEPKSLPESSMEGAEISSPLGFRALGGSPLLPVLLSGGMARFWARSLWPDDKFRG